MSSPRRIPSRTDFPANPTKDDYTRLRGLLNNDQLLSQRLLAQASGTRDATQTYASATYIGTNPSYAETTFNRSIRSPVSLPVRPTQGNTWNTQRMPGGPTTSRNAIRGTPVPNHIYYASREESVVPEGAVFPIDIPIPRHNNPSFSDSELIGRRRNNLTPYPARRATSHHDPLAGQTLVASTISYDDREIPQHDFSWIVHPLRHPWIRSGQAYLCRYPSCDTIVQAKNRRNHNSRVHGINSY